jgi:hypothetical protein
MEYVDSTPCSQDLTNDPHCTPDNSNPHTHTLLIWRPILIISSYVCLYLPGSSFLHSSQPNFCTHFPLRNGWNAFFIYELIEPICTCNVEAPLRKSLLPLKTIGITNCVCVCDSLICPKCNAHRPYWHLGLSVSTFSPHYLKKSNFQRKMIYWT